MSQSSARPDDESEFAELFTRLRRGLIPTIAIAALGFAGALIAFFLYSPSLSRTSSIRVVFSFAGFERGEYPDKSKFAPDDIRSPEVIMEALKRKGLDATQETQAKVRAALTIEGVIPENIVRERDKQRALGQTPRVYVPDEYLVSLALPNSFPLNTRQREQLLTEIVSVFQDKFTRTYIALPLQMGTAFESLVDADYFDYDLVLSRESENITAFLAQMSTAARAFRSPRTNLTFQDLLKQAQLFTQIRLNEVLGIIRRDGLSRDRRLAMVKMDYYLQRLEDQERAAIEEEKVVTDLLKQAQDRQQSYTLGVKSNLNAPRADGSLVDQNLIDSLLANDAYNFLVRKALDASLNTRRIQSEKAILVERRATMEAFIKSNSIDRAEAVGDFKSSLASLHKVYDALIANIRATYEDYQRQQFNDAIRVSMQASSSSLLRTIAMAGIAGAFIGAAIGIGLSLLGVYPGRR